MRLNPRQELVDPDPLLAKLGKHRTGKSCLHIRSLADIDLAILEQIVTGFWRLSRKRYPAAD